MQLFFEKGVQIRDMVKLHSIVSVLFFIVFVGLQNVSAQTSNCTGGTPSYTVNLSSNASGVWTSSNIVRAGQCCGGGGDNNNCVEFIVTLSPNAEAFVLDIIGGATPSGSLSYTVNCGTPTPIGGKFCVTGVGPHYISFCKSGNNDNVYRITSIQKPMVSANMVTRIGCSSRLVAYGFQESTIQWRALTPAYQSLLTCASACDTTSVVPPSNPPSFVDFEVSGTPLGACSGVFSRDTVRVGFVAGMTVNVSPANSILCWNETTKALTANVTGGNPPYTYSWSNGATTQTINVGPGTYTVTVSDQTSCPIYNASATVVADTDNNINAGADQTFCSHTFPINLSGTSSQGGTWVGGAGTFNPSRNSLNAQYTPSAAELAAGTVTLTLQGNACAHCPARTDAVTYTLKASPNTNISGSQAICGVLNQEENYSTTLNAGNTYNWSVTGGVIVSTNNNTIRVRWTNYGSYQVNVTESPANACSVSKSLNVNVSQTPSTGTINH